MNECNDPDHGAINAERSESRGLRKAWIELDDKRQELERELTAARAEIERLDVSGIHSCHDNCQRWTCVLRRELRAVTEQRDRLAEACKKLMAIIGEPNSLIDDCWVSEDEMDEAWNIADEALQSLTKKEL